MVSFDRPQWRRFKRAIATAIRHKEDTFMFDGHGYYVPFAIYLAGYLDERLSKEEEGMEDDV